MSSCFILLNREKIDLSYGVLDVILEHKIHTIMSVTPQAPVSILKDTLWVSAPSTSGLCVSPHIFVVYACYLT